MKTVHFDFIIKNFVLRGFNFFNVGVRVIGKNHYVLYTLNQDGIPHRKYGVYRKFKNKHKRLKGWKFKFKAHDRNCHNRWRHRDEEDFPSFHKVVKDYWWYKDVEETLA